VQFTIARGVNGAIGGSYCMTLANPREIAYDYSVTIGANGHWSMRGGTGTNAIVASGIVLRDNAYGDWSFTQVTPATSSHLTAIMSGGELSGFLESDGWPTSGVTSREEVGLPTDRTETPGAYPRDLPDPTHFPKRPQSGSNLFLNLRRR
jgi:hypothetical protein